MAGSQEEIDTNNIDALNVFFSECFQEFNVDSVNYVLDTLDIIENVFANGANPLEETMSDNQRQLINEIKELSLRSQSIPKYFDAHMRTALIPQLGSLKIFADLKNLALSSTLFIDEDVGLLDLNNPSYLDAFNSTVATFFPVSYDDRSKLPKEYVKNYRIFRENAYLLFQVLLERRAKVAYYKSDGVEQDI